MQIPPEQGQFMAFLVKAIGAKRIIEIGTYTGYSALCMAQALPPDGTLVACDLFDAWLPIARPHWEQAGVEGKIDFRLGDAVDTMDAMIAEGQSGTYDLVFIDADKPNLDRYYERALALLRPGGVVAVDNVLLFGAVLDKSVLTGQLAVLIGDDAIAAVQDLNAKIAADPRVETLSLLPIGDGLTLALKR
jgi:predicted O-methyltransferase YrrM